VEKKNLENDPGQGGWGKLIKKPKRKSGNLRNAGKKRGATERGGGSSRAQKAF